MHDVYSQCSLSWTLDRPLRWCAGAKFVGTSSAHQFHSGRIATRVDRRSILISSRSEWLSNAIEQRRWWYRRFVGTRCAQNLRPLARKCFLWQRSNGEMYLATKSVKENSLPFVQAFVFPFAGAVPENSKQYYGFTRFAIELNELDDELRQHLPPTDTRFRPDQR